MSVVVQPSARKRFTPRDLVAAYEDFVGGAPQYVDAETGIKASAYRFGADVLLVYKESEAGVVVLCSPECVEGKFSEVRVDGALGSQPPRSSCLGAAPGGG